MNDAEIEAEQRYAEDPDFHDLVHKILEGRVERAVSAEEMQQAVLVVDRNRRGNHAVAMKNDG